MNHKLLFSIIFLSISGGASANLATDAEAHRACQARLKNVSRTEQLNLRAGPTYRAPQPGTGQYRYYINATSRTAQAPGREYRVECEARQNGRIQRFTLEPGRWRYDRPETYAAR